MDLNKFRSLILHCPQAVNCHTAADRRMSSLMPSCEKIVMAFVQTLLNMISPLIGIKINDRNGYEIYILQYFIFLFFTEQFFKHFNPKFNFW